MRAFRYPHSMILLIASGGAAVASSIAIAWYSAISDIEGTLLMALYLSSAYLFLLGATRIGLAVISICRTSRTTTAAIASAAGFSVLMIASSQHWFAVEWKWIVLALIARISISPVLLTSATSDLTQIGRMLCRCVASTCCCEPPPA